MAGQETQRAAFNFLREHLYSQEVFTLQQFIDATGWDKPGTFLTHYRKHYKGVTEELSGRRRNCR